MPSKSAQLSFILFITALLIGLLALMIVTLLLLYKKRQFKYLELIETIKNDYEKNILGAQLEMQEQTLQHISREIHDNINLGLTLAKLTLTSAAPAALQQKSGEAINHITTAIENLTALSRNIGAHLVEEEGLLAAIKNELGKLTKAGQYKVVFNCTGEPVFMEGKKELVIFRMVQEALNNIIKHAHANQITLSMNYGERELNITIADDGCGIAHCPPGHIPAKGAGLGNMKKRAAMVGGYCEITTGAKGGTAVLITIPMAETLPGTKNVE
jgi:two-component system, NarL family, sensor kinase